MATDLKCDKISPRTLATKEMAVTSRQYTVSHFLLHQGIFYQQQRNCRPLPILLFSLSSVEDKTEKLPF
jgi:hypothetical protein